MFLTPTRWNEVDENDNVDGYGISRVEAVLYDGDGNTWPGTLYLPLLAGRVPANVSYAMY